MTYFIVIYHIPQDKYESPVSKAAIFTNKVNWREFKKTIKAKYPVGMEAFSLDDLHFRS